MFTFNISPSQELKFLMFFRFFQRVVSHPDFWKDKDLQKFMKEKNVSFSSNKILLLVFGHNPCEYGWFFPHAINGKTTLDLNFISIFFIKSTIIINIFIFRGHKCFKDKISWHNIHWATSKELCRNGVKIELQFTATISSSTSQCCRMV